MEYYPFPALLLAQYNTTHEYGQANVFPPTSIDFVSDFVPLLPLGASATIEWILGAKCLAEFSGSVYLSSPKLLRIVDIAPATISAVADIVCINTHLPAWITLAEKTYPLQRTPRIPVEILYLTNNSIKLRCAADIPAGSHISLFAEVNFLTLRELPLRVKDRVVMRRDENLLLCEVGQGGDDNFVALSTYAARLAALEQQKL